MSSMTAQLGVGHPDTYHGGIAPTHIVWLSENSRPAWILQSVWRGFTSDPDDAFDEADGPTWTDERTVWVPSGPESILEDGLLLIATHVVNDPDVLGLAQDELP